MRAELLPGVTNVVRFPVERRVWPTLELLREIAPDVREVLAMADALGVEAADPRLPSTAGAPPWYFLPVHQIIRTSPRDLLGVDGARFLVGAACGLGLVVVALPFLDRRGSRITFWAAWILLLVLLLLASSALT